MCYYYLRVLCGYGGTGRRDRLRIYCQNDVEVQVLLAAPDQIGSFNKILFD